jgi:hydrogenase maturation protease
MLKPHLSEINEKNTLFVGIGNVLKKDDGVGVYITKNLSKSNNRKVLTVEVSIENYIGKINNMNPEIIVLIDSMDFGKSPGYFDLLPVEQITGYTTNTHNITLDKVSELFNSQIYILGIQPESIKFGEGLTKKIQKTADLVIEKINSIN